MTGEKITNTKRNLKNEALKIKKSRAVPPNSISVSCIGSDMGEIVYIKDFTFTNQQINSITNIKEEFNPEYIYYNLKLKKNFFHSIADGSTMPIINKTKFSKIEIDLPSLDVQNSVTHILSNIDEKIKNNQGTIANLEELSQTLFKRWFVDFEFLNEEGNPFKSSGGQLVSSELGDIPAGWEVKQLKSLAHHKKDTFNPNKTKEEQVYHFSLPAYDSDAIPVIEQVSEIKSNKWFVDKNCVLFSKMNPRTMRVWLTDVEEEKMNVCSTEFVVLESDSSSQNSFIYNVCKSDNFAYFLQSNATGSTNSRQKIRPNVALDYKLAINTNVMEELAVLLEPYTNEIIALRKETSSLTLLRDTLLPKLMSGEIELADDMEVKDHAELLQ